MITWPSPEPVQGRSCRFRARASRKSRDSTRARPLITSPVEPRADSDNPSPTGPRPNPSSIITPNQPLLTPWFLYFTLIRQTVFDTENSLQHLTLSNAHHSSSCKALPAALGPQHQLSCDHTIQTLAPPAAQVTDERYLVRGTRHASQIISGKLFVPHTRIHGHHVVAGSISSPT